MSERIGLRFPESIDKISVPETDDGFYRLSIGHFESWESIENPCDKLREKLEYYLSVIKGGGLHDRFPEISGKNGRISLMTYGPLPENIKVFFEKLKISAQLYGVQLDHQIIEPAR